MVERNPIKAERLASLASVRLSVSAVLQTELEIMTALNFRVEYALYLPYFEIRRLINRIDLNLTQIVVSKVTETASNLIQFLFSKADICTLVSYKTLFMALIRAAFVIATKNLLPVENIRNNWLNAEELAKVDITTKEILKAALGKEVYRKYDFSLS